jgi:photoactive yellow protein
MGVAYPITCAWCGLETGQIGVPNSSSICASCSAKLLGVPMLSAEELNALPYGAIELDAAGLILSYNQAEGALAGLDPARVIGKNFFKQIAPCTDVQSFHGQFNKFLQSSAGMESFKFKFPFPDRLVKVNITLISTDRMTAFVLIQAFT